MVLNTTTGPKEFDPRGRPGHVVNTSHAVEENIQYLDEEPEIVSVVPATGWRAQMVGDVGVPLVAFVALDSGRMYGVALDEDGRIDLVEGDVEKQPGFAGYEQANNER